MINGLSSDCLVFIFLHHHFGFDHIMKPMTSAPLVYVRTRSDHGPYFSPTKGKYQCSTLRDVIFHTRLAMEDGEDCIGVFHGEECKGIWCKEWDAEPDGEGGMERSKEWYAFYRASEKNYALLVGQF